MKNGPLVHDQFSRFFYETGGFLDLAWMGVPILKCPFDMHMYQELVFETKPGLIIETGAFLGGSTLFFAQLCDLMGQGRVVSVELETANDLPQHPRITYMLGRSSTEPDVVRELHGLSLEHRTMVVLDSSHNRAHVLRELQLYSPLVSKGCYLIAEDTNVHGYPLCPPRDKIADDGGPAEAVKEWQPVNHGFEVDRRFERLRMSFNPGGYLRRTR